MSKIKNIIFAILVSFCYTSTSQIIAITETGDKVILYNDGSWIYDVSNHVINSEIKTNNKLFKKDKKSTFLVKSKVFNIGVYLNPQDWSFEKDYNDPTAEYIFNYKNGDLYAMMITEEMEIPLEVLKGIALENGRSAAPDIHIAKEEYRTVNGHKLLMLQLNGTIEGIKFSYYGYYFSNENGTVQLITYTSQSLFNKYKEAAEKLLNGFVEL